jgi:hypothetical protein
VRNTPALVTALAALTAAVAVFVLLSLGPRVVAGPAQAPAQPEAGAAGWTWASPPGYEPGEALATLNTLAVQPDDVAAARTEAIAASLEPDSIRVLIAARPLPHAGLQAILFARPAMPATDNATCLTALLPSGARPQWRCPGRSDGADLARSPIFLAARTSYFPATADRDALYSLSLAGVARGDVRQIVFAGGKRDREVIYTRGISWGQFSASLSFTRVPSRTRILAIGERGTLKTILISLDRDTDQILY